MLLLRGHPGGPRASSAAAMSLPHPSRDTKSVRFGSPPKAAMVDLHQVGHERLNEKIFDTLAAARRNPARWSRQRGHATNHQDFPYD